MSEFDARGPPAYRPSSPDLTNERMEIFVSTSSLTIAGLSTGYKFDSCRTGLISPVYYQVPSGQVLTSPVNVFLTCYLSTWPDLATGGLTRIGGLGVEQLAKELPVSCDCGSSGRTSRSTTTGPGRGLIGYEKGTTFYVTEEVVQDSRKRVEERLALAPDDENAQE
jgi:hypothetical protein